jgi:hypothetical protein
MGSQLTMWDKRDITGAFSHNNEFSYRASKSVDKSKQRNMVLNCIKSSPKTCDEVEVLLEMSHQACSARFTELKALDLIKLVGKRKTRSGRMAGVWSVS